MADKPLISAGEIRGIAKALLEWIRTCPDIPSDMKIAYQYLEDEQPCMSLHTLSGAVKRVVFVDDSYEGYYPFALYLRDSPDSNNTRIECMDTLDNIAEWIGTQESYPSIGEGKYVYSINQVSNAILTKRFENGFEDYIVTFELIYEKE